MDGHVTRTILITNFSKNISHSDLLRTCKTYGEVKEHFIMNNKHSVFFVCFYDLRSAQKAYSSLVDDKNKFTVKYAISLKEIPKGSDSCSEDKNQGSVTYTASEEIKAENENEVSDVVKKGKEITAKFYDSREALKYLEAIKASHPRASPKIVWDNDLRKRITLLKAAEEIVKNAPQGFFKGIVDDEKPQKRHINPVVDTEAKKKVKISTNWMIAEFDKFIMDNADEIAAELN
ncbi:hypothetical protein NEMIN01_1089 [Nematocida minor]|uniref:uncharacterized protein n=1 Tax=Nematocida minor TaxID=1912983 RepID=UPI00221F7F1F|nr:uncharacterized protein NEMIN01_1089 [Nematocida minor]KAI5190551.1 hypothetical protein NEMIN01_1089 [Nematocida minor]